MEERRGADRDPVEWIVDGERTYSMFTRSRNELKLLDKGDTAFRPRYSTDGREGSDASSLSFGVLLSNLTSDRGECVGNDDACSDGENGGLHRSRRV